VDRFGAPEIAFCLLLLGALLFNGWRVVPYTPLAPRQVVQAPANRPDRTLRLLIANVRMENRRADDLLARVRAHDPDVVLAAEGDAWWDERLRVLEADYPHAVRRPQDNHYGLHLFSKLELAAVEVRFLVDDDVPSIRARLRLRSGENVLFYGVHPRPPLPKQGSEQRDAELLIVGREVARDGGPTIVAGDLNDVAWSHTTSLFQRTSHLLDPRRGRGFFNTFPAGYPFLLRWPLDHVFHDDSLTLVGLRCLANIGSDHLPVLVELQHQPQAEAIQDEPTPDGDDREEATDRIHRGRDAA
jgi:endonuclease/exonuclease/phosphatase (EEP) superfamily protein YafD